MASINPYTHFNGNAEEVFTFYRSAFGGEFAMITRFKDFSNPEHPVSEKEANKTMHIALPIGKSSVLMGSDTPEFMGRHNENENRSKISITADSKEKQTNYLMGFQKMEKLKCLLMIVHGVLILECLGTNTGLNGW